MRRKKRALALSVSYMKPLRYIMISLWFISTVVYAKHECIHITDQEHNHETGLSCVRYKVNVVNEEMRGYLVNLSKHCSKNHITGLRDGDVIIKVDDEVIDIPSDIRTVYYNVKSNHVRLEA